MVRWWSRISRESPGAQMVPSGVSSQKPHASSGWWNLSLVPGCAFCQAWSAGVSVTATGPTVNRSPMSCPWAGSSSPSIKDAT